MARSCAPTHTRAAARHFAKTDGRASYGAGARGIRAVAVPAPFLSTASFQPHTDAALLNRPPRCPQWFPPAAPQAGSTGSVRNAPLPAWVGPAHGPRRSPLQLERSRNFPKNGPPGAPWRAEWIGRALRERSNFLGASAVWRAAARPATVGGRRFPVCWNWLLPRRLGGRARTGWGRTG